MSPTVLANIALKVVAIYLMAQGVMQVPGIVTIFQFSTSQMNENNQILPVMVAAILTPLIIGAALWLVSNKLSGVIVRGLECSDNSSISVAHIQAVAISTIGLILLVLTLPQLISLATLLFGTMYTVNDEKVLNINILSSFMAAGVKVILGIALVMGAPGWVRLLYKIRGLGFK